MSLDPASLDAIAQEVRQCFLEEDAPAYLEALQTGLQQFSQGQVVDYPALRRAAHSLKGGAGLSQIAGLSELAHKLEDLLQALHQQQVTDQQKAWELLRRGVEEITILLSQARSSQVCYADATLLQALEEFQQPSWALNADETPTLATGNFADAYLVKTALEMDLEDCLVRLEQLLQGEGDVVQGLSNLVEECTLLGEALDLPWLIQAVMPISTALSQHDQSFGESSEDTARSFITQLRSLRTQYLQGKLPTPSASSSLEISEEIEPLAASLITESTAVSTDLKLGQSPSVTASEPSAHLRIPLSKLEYMTNTVGELITNNERFHLQQQQLEQASLRLQRLTQQFEPIRNQVQAFYDQLAISTLDESLQTFQELILQIQETHADIDLMNRELVENQEQARQNLDRVYAALTQSRLVPFRRLAQRFLPQLRQLNQRYGKVAKLVIQGEDVLVDQVLLEQLQTPLTHLLNNAFDHGIEPPAERLALEKPETAQILLQATAQENQVVITLRDDGRGIDLQKVYQQALQQKLCPQTPMDHLSQEEILAFLFQPGFSTAPTVNDLSGRGMGLNIVHTQMSRLRGTVQVQTIVGQGTTFTIKLPPGLSLLPLLVCRSQRRLVAIPTTSVLEILPCSELTQVSTTPPLVSWRQQSIPVVSLLALLPYPNLPVDNSQSQVGIVLDGPDSPLVVTVDALIGERQLILKPFDDTVTIPPYLAGCTILGTGEVVPVVLPYHFGCLLQQPKLPTPAPAHPPRQQRTRRRTILVAEDSLANQRLLERVLTQQGYTVVICRDGQEALDELEQRHGSVDLVISDIEMPRLNGFNLLRQIRTNSYWHALPVVMLTSRTGNPHRDKAMSLGASAYMTKPVDPKKLLSGINLVLLSEVGKPPQGREQGKQGPYSV